MKSIGSLRLDETYIEAIKKRKTAPHRKAAMVDEILTVIQPTEKYPYTYWLRQLKLFERKGGAESIILGWLKEIDSYPSNFNKGACLTNKFRKWIKANSKQ